VGTTPDRAGDQQLQAIANRLRALRLARGLTQWQLAERGLSYKYYQRIESGQANVTIRTLVRIARALGVPFHELFRFDSDASASRRAPTR
jgi:transcriptional regulator with XRE-family HTH domain